MKSIAEGLGSIGGDEMSSAAPDRKCKLHAAESKEMPAWRIFVHCLQEMMGSYWARLIGQVDGQAIRQATGNQWAYQREANSNRPGGPAVKQLPVHCPPPPPPWANNRTALHHGTSDSLRVSTAPSTCLGGEACFPMAQATVRVADGGAAESCS